MIIIQKHLIARSPLDKKTCHVRYRNLTLQCGCSVLQCVAAWRRVVQCGTVWCRVAQGGAGWRGVVQGGAGWCRVCRVVQCVTVCVLQCVTVCCSVLQCVLHIPGSSILRIESFRTIEIQHQCVVVCSVLQCVAVCCSVLQCVAVCCSVLQCVLHIPVPSIQKIESFRTKETASVCYIVVERVAVCCSVLQCVAVRCSVLQLPGPSIQTTETQPPRDALRSALRVYFCVQKKKGLSQIYSWEIYCYNIKKTLLLIACGKGRTRGRSREMETKR